MIQLGWAAAVAVVSLVSKLLSAPTFHPAACERFEESVNRHLVGQEPAVRVLSDSICEFLLARRGGGTGELDASPLVVSLHGPPGVGKTYFHKLAARALYGVDERCPGRGCPGYKVLFGMDYSSNDVDAQHQLLQESLMDHLAVYPQSLIVIEEYDKLDCHMRGFFRQMLQGNQLASGNRTASLRDSIVVLESNMGQTVLHGLLESGASPAGPRRREDVPMADAVRGLKDMLFSRWREQGCEDFSDSQKFMRSIDHVLPFYPLEEADIVELFFKKLKGYEDASGGRVVCDDQCRDVVVPFLVDKVEFDGRFPLEGGKEVNTVSTGYLSRAFRRFLEEEADGATDERRGWRVDAERVAVLIEDRRVGVRRSSTSENGSQEGS